MTLTFWLGQFPRCLMAPRPAPSRRRLRPKRSRLSLQSSWRPSLELLEDRITPTTFTPTVFTDGVTGGVQTLRDAVIAANNDLGTASDTIQLSAGTYQLTIPNNASIHEILGTQGDLNILSTSHPLVIQGATDPVTGKPTTIIEQTVADRVFEIYNAGSNVVFRNVVIEGGQAHDDGTAGAVAGSTNALGGGILDNGGNVTLSNVMLQNNSAKAGQGQEALGGGIYASNGVLTIDESITQNNQAVGGMAASRSSYGNVGSGGGIAFTSPTASQLTITNSTVAANQAVGGQGIPGQDSSGGLAAGGGIAISLKGGSTAVLTASTVSDNSAIGGAGQDTSVNGPAVGGGIDFAGGSAGDVIQLVNVTIAANKATDGIETAGGGVHLVGGNVSFTNVTVADNIADTGGTGGGIISDSESFVTLVNTIVANNKAATSPDYCGYVRVSDHNLIDIAEGSGGFSAAHGDLLGTRANPLNPNLGPLADNGGPTRTMALLPGSPAIDAGDNNALSVTGPYDQRGTGFPRLAGAVIDIGAFENQSPPPATPSQSPPPASPSLFQALLSLYIDGAYLEAANLSFQFIANIDEFGIVPSVTADAHANAAAAGINLDTAQSLFLILGRLRSNPLTALSDIHANLPYAGSFGLFAVAAGAEAMLQASQL